MSNSGVTLAKIRAGTAVLDSDTTSNNAVKAIQRALKMMGYYLILSSSYSGIYDKYTKAAVKGYQNEKGLTVTGTVNKATLNSIETSTTTLYETHNTSPAFLSIRYGFDVSKVGDTGTAVNQIRALLNKKGHTVPTTGTFDTTLKNAVVEFQKKHHLDADGVVGQGTLAALENTKAYTAWLSNGKVSLTAGLLAECGFSGYILGFGVTELNTALNSFNINTKEKVRHFLAQCMYETYNGTLVAEVGYEAGVGGSKSYSPYYGAGYLHLTSKASYYSDPAPLNFYDYLKNTAKITDDKVKTPAAYATQHVAIKYPGRSAGWVWDKLKNINSSSVINWNSDSTTICTAITKLISGSSSTASDRHKNYADKICPILK